MPNNDRPERTVTPLPVGDKKSVDSPFDLPAEQLERIVARASTLQHAAGEGESRGLSEQEIIAIAREVGLEAKYVQRAIAEYRADTLAPRTTDLFPWLTRLVGPPWVRVRRVVHGDPERVHRAVERRLRDQEHLRPTRMRGTSSVWEPDKSWARQLQRALDFEGRSYELSKPGPLEVVAAPVSPDSSLVTLTLDINKLRNDHAMSWGLGAGIPTLVLGYSWLNWGALFITIPALAAAALFCRWSLASRRQRLALVLEGLLDQVEASR